MTDSRKDLPAPGSPNFAVRTRELIMQYLGRQGDPLDRGITLRDLVGSKILQINGPLAPGLPSGGLPVVPGPGAGGGETDMTPPPQPTLFTATGAFSHIIIEQAPPLYTQGGGHFRTRLYGKKVNAGDPLPVFGDAVELTQFEGIIYAHPAEPGATWRLWTKWETRAGVLSPTPAGGTNGVEATTGQNVSALVQLMTGPGNPFKVVPDYVTLADGTVVPPGTYTSDAYIHNGFIQNAMIANLAVDSAKIANVSASKITAGSLQVGAYIESSNFLAGLSGWRINADGTAELHNVVARGTVYATAGLIGGNTIDATGVQSATFVAPSLAAPGGFGWRLDNLGRFRLFNTNTYIDTAATGAQTLVRFGSAFTVLANGNATFSGALSAATGTFSGALSAASGTFRGALQGATGEFAGTLRAGVVDFAATQGVTYTFGYAGGWQQVSVPTGRNRMRVTVLGAGGGGGGGHSQNMSNSGGGGGAGGIRRATFVVSSGQVIQVFVGKGGDGGNPDLGGQGGQESIIAGYISAGGGQGGQGALGFTASGSGGAGGAGDPNGQSGGTGQLANFETGVGWQGGSGYGGSSSYGAGGASVQFSPGLAGGGSGAGGSGGGWRWPNNSPAVFNRGGNGSHGLVIIEFFDANGVVLRNDYDILLSALTRQGIAIV